MTKRSPVMLLSLCALALAAGAHLFSQEEDPVNVLKGGKGAEEAPAPAAESPEEAVPSEAGEPESAGAEEAAAAASDFLRKLDPGEIVDVYRVPITEAISQPNLFILRRAIKQAIREEVEVLLIDMDTPGGRLDVTLEMMELLDRFEGETITFVNKDAISAGAYISMATDAIYFAPDGVMGAAAVVSGGGQEIDESMKAKINSYLMARMRSYTDRYPYRAQVIQAMADLDYELEIDGEILKEPGELLSLTAKEARQNFGDPPMPLLAEGISEDVESLLADRYGEERANLVDFEISWSEEAAKYLNSIAPLLLGLGLLGLFVEFKTPGFGIMGIAGLTLVAIVFASNYLAGLAGLEGLLFFLIGLVLIVVDIFLLPGTFVFMIVGILFIFGALLWSLADVWPAPKDGGGFTFTVDADSLWMALYEVLGAFAIAVLGLILIWRFLPVMPVYGRLVHQTAGAMPDRTVTGGSQIPGANSLPDVGSRGRVTRPLHPLGEVEIEGKRYQATVGVGSLDRDTPVIVTGYRHFCLLVDKEDAS
mgnify:FL=1